MRALIWASAMIHTAACANECDSVLPSPTAPVQEEQSCPVYADATEPPVVFERLLAAWEVFFEVELPDSCHIEPQWRVLAPEELATVCPSGASGCLRVSGAGCVVGISKSGLYFPGELYTHEMAHWFLRCSGRASGSEKHLEEDVWKEGGWVPETARAVKEGRLP